MFLLRIVTVTLMGRPGRSPDELLMLLPELSLRSRVSSRFGAADGGTGLHFRALLADYAVISEQRTRTSRQLGSMKVLLRDLRQPMSPVRLSIAASQRDNFEVKAVAIRVPSGWWVRETCLHLGLFSKPLWKARPELGAHGLSGERFAAVFTNHNCVGGLAALVVPRSHWWTVVASHPSISPSHDGGQYRVEILAFVSQHVLVPFGVLLIRDPVEQAFLDQPLQAQIQGIARQAQRPLEVIETADAGEGLPQHQWGPPVAQQVHGAGD